MEFFPCAIGIQNDSPEQMRTQPASRRGSGADSPARLGRALPSSGRAMKTILVLTPHPDFAETLQGGLNPEQFRVVHRASLDEAEPLLAHSLIHACILDVEMTGVQGVWVLEKIRRHDARCPIVVFTDAKQPEWEEQAYLQGVTHVLTKPVRLRLLTALLDRILAAPARRVPLPPSPAAPVTSDTTRFPELSPSMIQTADVLRDFSSILTHSLDSSALLKQFLLLLRRMVSLNRATVFLRQPPGELTGFVPKEENRRMHAACAIGLSSSLLEHFELSLDTGIGGQLLRLGRILRRHSDEARQDPEVQKEFELLGGQVAVPMFDRETLIGVAVLDGRVTGEPLVNAELELIFHLLEQVSLAIRNIWLHDQLSANHEMLTGVLRELGSACVVVSRDLKLLHANKTARKFFGKGNRAVGDLEFTDLPQVLATKLYQVLRTGTAIAPFKFEPVTEKGGLYNVTIVPFQREAGAPAASALLIAEDLTQTEQLRRLEVEASNLRLVKTMADRLAHEVGNAMVPLSTHQQLLAEKYRDAEFRASLDSALADGVKRVTRVVNQMRFLARDAAVSQETFPVAPLIEEAFQEARKHQPAKTAQLKYDTSGKSIIVTGDRAALKYALTEVMINALQANPGDAKIGVRLHSETRVGEHAALQIEVQDNGTGFTPEAMQRAAAPFYTTRNVGLGLGLAVSRKIIETHHGKLEIVTPKTGHSGVVRISLPSDAEVGGS